MLGSAGATRST